MTKHAYRLASLLTLVVMAGPAAADSSRSPLPRVVIPPRASAQVGSCSVDPVRTEKATATTPATSRNLKLAGSRAAAEPGGRASAGESLMGPLAAVDHRTTGDGPDRCESDTPRRSMFSVNEPGVWHLSTVTGAAAGDVIRWEWIRPDGEVHKSTQLVLATGGRVCFWDGLPLSRDDTGQWTGAWRVRVLANHAVLATDAFNLTDGDVDAHGRLTRQLVMTHWIGMIRLGFAVGRAWCAGSSPIGPEALALIREDLIALENSLLATSAVIRFDRSRVSSLRERIPAMTGDAAWPELDRLFQEILAAVRDARLSCHAGTAPLIPPPVLEAFTVAAYRLGLVVSMSTCFPCDQPLPYDIVAFIRGQLGAARSEVLPYLSCLPGFSISMFDTPRLGEGFAREISYVDLSAIYSVIQMAILNGDCTCGTEGATQPPTSGGTVRGTVRNASNGQPIAGAVVAVAGTNLSATTGADGSYTLNNVPSGQQTLNASASGFISTQVNVSVTAGQTLTQNLSLSPVLQAGEIRITLNWTKDGNGAPRDLDMHLIGPQDGGSCFHVYYSGLGSLSSSPYALLEVDNINVPGSPPTETIRIARLTPGVYRFYVHQYSNDLQDGLSLSRATAQVFGSSGLMSSNTVPTGSGRYWTVFTMNGGTGGITAVNEMGGSAPPATCR